MLNVKWKIYGDFKDRLNLKAPENPKYDFINFIPVSSTGIIIIYHREPSTNNIIYDCISRGELRTKILKLRNDKEMIELIKGVPLITYTKVSSEFIDGATKYLLKKLPIAKWEDIPACKQIEIDEPYIKFNQDT